MAGDEGRARDRRARGGVGRRGFLVGGAVAAGGLALGRVPAGAAPAVLRRGRSAPIPPLAPAGTTLEATIRPTGPGPFRRLVDGPGEPTRVRPDLAAPKAGREDRRRAVAAFVQFTDQHLIDAQSPGRVEFLDLVDPLFGGAFRPQELLTTHVATSMVERVRALGHGPVAGRRLDAVVCTGDNIDNQQRNELGWLLTILDGGTVTPDSGELGTYQGAQDRLGADRSWWHPDPGIDDTFKAQLGFPDAPGLLERALVPFASPGLDVPWFSVYGNHDCNVQGNASRTDALDDIFGGDRKMVALPAGEGALAFILRVMGDSPSVLADLRRGAIPAREVVADDARRTATVADWVRAHVASPTGTHGYHPEDVARGRLYHEFDLAPGVVGIALDTTNHAGGPGGADGSIGTGQLAWLEARLAAHHRRFLDAAGHPVRSGGDDRYVVVFSHHTSATMDAVDPDPAHPTERRVQGAELASVLLRYPNVVAWVNGHTHTNELIAHRPPPGLPGGFWEVTTASHVDWPQQARVLELVDNLDGTISLIATMIEHAAPAGADLDAADVVGLSGVSRLLGANDASADPMRKAGSADARNVELVVAAPFTAGSGPVFGPQPGWAFGGAR